MSELELSIRYPMLSKREERECLALWLVLGIVLAAMIGMLSRMLHMEHNVLMEMLVVLAAMAGYCYVPFNVAIKQSEGASLHVNKDGLGMPSKFLGASSWLHWSHLKSVDVRGKEHRLLLTFAGRQIRIEQTRISEKEMQQLLLAVEVWGTHAQWTQTALDYRDKLQNKVAGIDKGSYTELWEEELQRRFNSTTFIPLEPGRRVGNDALTIVKQLAFGGFSAVYLAKDAEGREVVVKESVASAQNSDDALQKKAIEMFQREAELLGTMTRHEQIARVLDHFVEQGRNYLVLEYIPGDNLRQYVKKFGKQDERKVLAWMQQMIELVGHLHSQSPPIVHRDFTPDNLVLRPDGKLVLIDFGAANQFLSNATGTLVGKQCYMPPEQVRGKTEPASDIYALGCTAYFLLTGKDPPALTECHPRDVDSSISVAVDNVVASLTKLDPAKRILAVPTAVEPEGQKISLSSLHQEKIR